MGYAYLDFKIKDLEEAAYDLATCFTKKGYACKVVKSDNGFTAIITKARFFKNIVGTPTVIKAHFFNEDFKSVIHVYPSNNDFKAGDYIKETLLAVTILPGISKGIQLISLEKEVRREALKVAVCLEAKGEKSK